MKQKQLHTFHIDRQVVKIRGTFFLVFYQQTDTHDQTLSVIQNLCKPVLEFMFQCLALGFWIFIGFPVHFMLQTHIYFKSTC